MPPIDRKAVGARIRQARERAGFHSQEAFGREIGAHRNTISAWEQGDWTVENLERVAECTGVEWTWILHGDERIIDQRALDEIRDRLERIERKVGL